MSLPYSFTLYPDEPIMLVTITSKYSIIRDQPISDIEGFKILDAFSEPVYYINDIRKLRLTVNDVILAANQSSRIGTDNEEKKRPPIWRHPNIKEILLITTNPVVKLAAPGMKKEVFGGLTVKTFDTLEDTLEYIRSQVSNVVPELDTVGAR